MVSTELQRTNCETMTGTEVRGLTNWATQAPLQIPLQNSTFNSLGYVWKTLSFNKLQCFSSGLFCVFKKLFNAYLFLREWERDRAWSGGGMERERETESEAGSRFWAVSTEPNAGLELTLELMLKLMLELMRTHELWDHEPNSDT